uniref:Uncharacterized protein n=1 Tax=Medicago truncatula TaxID=3880 RepID=I3SAU3_MEDTR|nr:unknown [Medicago truncatula]
MIITKWNPQFCRFKSPPNVIQHNKNTLLLGYPFTQFSCSSFFGLLVKFQIQGISNLALNFYHIWRTSYRSHNYSTK